MFKAAFPYSSIADQEQEKEFHRTLPSGHGEEIAGNVWIAPGDGKMLRRLDLLLD